MMFGLFKRKKKQIEFVLQKQVEYRGHVIFLWVREAEGYKTLPEKGLYFDLGYSTDLTSGYYHSNTTSANIEKCLLQFVEDGKRAIDAALLKPIHLEQAKQSLENLKLT